MIPMNDHHCDYYLQKGSTTKGHETKNNQQIFNSNDDPLWPGLLIAGGRPKINTRQIFKDLNY